MNNSITRRNFLKQTSTVTAGLAVLGGANRLRAAKGPNDKVLIGVCGFHNKGMDHLKSYLSLPNVEVAYVCDVDSHMLDKGLATVIAKQQRKPKAVKDMRRILDDPEVDAISLAIPDHWHATATLMACQAGKHVYVEKPDAHNAHEGELMVAAARKYNRLVQLGTHLRSWPTNIEAVAALQSGELGKLFFARCWYTSNRKSIGHAPITPVPEWLDYTMWQGPAPEMPYRPHKDHGDTEASVHYNWHWFWNWGTAELANNGVHSIDLARWGLGIESAPRRVTCAGGRYHYDDDWETPDTAVANFDFGDKCIIWEGQSCDTHGFEDAYAGTSFYGENGCMAITGSKVRVYDLKNKVVREKQGPPQDSMLPLHFGNFINAIRGEAALHAEIETGHKSSLLAHLGNISWRTGRTINFDPQAGKIVGDDDAISRYWSRTYRPGWEPKV
jgi:predicted dehydrogenase